MPETLNSVHHLIRASAGTGKTYELTTRILDLLLQGIQPDTLLVTTFTRKAAFEITQRLLERLANAKLNPDGRQVLSDAVGRKITSTQLDQTILMLRNYLGRLQIGTIDSFFARIASGFHWDLDLPAGWRIGETTKLANIELETIDHLLNTAPLEQTLIALAELNERKAKRPVMNKVLDVVQTLRDHLPRLEKANHDNAWHWFPSTLTEPTETDIVTLITALENVVLPRTKTGKIDKRFDKAVKQLIQMLTQREWEQLTQKGLLPNSLQPEKTFYNRPIPDQLIELLQEISTLTFRALGSRHSAKNSAAAFLLTTFVTSYRLQRLRYGVVNFGDITRAIQSLGQMPLQDLFYRLDGFIHHVLIDEFQDTSYAQWSILQPILDEIFATADGTRSAFLVGDTKQAIYRWRGGSHELFDVIAQTYAVQESTKSRSFRSSQIILDTVNCIFQNLHLVSLIDPSTQDDHAQRKQEAFMLAATAWQQSYPKHEAAELKPGYVCIETVEQQDDDNELRFELAVQRADSLLELNSNLSIGILTRSNRSVLALQEAFRQGQRDDRLIAVLIALFHVADHPTDQASWYLLEHSLLLPALHRFLGTTSKSSRTEIAFELRYFSTHHGIGKLLTSLIEQLRNTCSNQHLRCLKRLAKDALVFDLEPWHRVSDFGRFVRLQNDHDLVSTAKAIQVMTIHQAKGLQFDAVILPDLDTKLVQAPPAVTLIEHRQKQQLQLEGFMLRPSKALLRVAPEPIRQAVLLDDYRDFHESLSILYVALTRAKHELYICLNAKSKPDHFSNIIRTTCLQQHPEGEPLSIGDSKWPHQLKQTITPSQQPSISLPTLEESVQKPLMRLEHKQPSNGTQTSQPFASDSFKNHNRTLHEFGNEVHKALEQLTWLSPPITKHSFHHTKAIHIYLQQAFSQQDIANHFQQAYYQTHLGWQDLSISVETERRFAVLLNKTVLSGTIDRLILGSTSAQITRAEIIDFKTDAVTETTLHEKIDLYRPQLTAYQQAIAQLYRLSPEAITTKLFFLGIGQVCEVDF
ncbi:ATP-dependent helicase/nuclease subunit A-like [Ylistrum balloti]|uniref:ATP-dependent helicase/nuclease subunit A-like n=1 Tax=Ylistrum balloti TaxID=509963 RepID=UPI002905AFC1|nr:ATP-dependent helicase/nuclease subunit A-like [Ylistrum balloti]